MSVLGASKRALRTWRLLNDLSACGTHPHNTRGIGRDTRTMRRRDTVAAEPLISP